MANWQIKQIKNGYQVSLFGKNGERVFVTEPYKTQANAERAIRTIERIVGNSLKKDPPSALPVEVPGPDSKA